MENKNRPGLADLKRKMENKAQVTIFVIIAIVLVAGVVLFFVLRTDSGVSSGLPDNLEPPYVGFLDCVEENTFLGISLLENQGGYIDLPEFFPGSYYSPFSSRLNFVGADIPYWYYVSAGNVEREQVPSKSSMEDQLADFIEERISECDLSTYYRQGYLLEIGEPRATTTIRDNKVEVNINMDFGITKNEDNSLLRTHRVEINSQLGELYDAAKVVYDKEQKELFLEKYGEDVLRLYAPVDGIELTCGPKIWNADLVFNDLEEAIEANTLALRSSGNSGDYFVVDAGTDKNVRFLNSRNWTRSFEVNPSEGPVLMAMPVGNQPGLGILGFCYVPYHFVYDVQYPVLVQVYEGSEIFQFPVAVVLRGNVPRQPFESSAYGEADEIELCNYKNTLINVNVYDVNRNPIDAEISYSCSGTSCYIGSTENGVLENYFPQCVNGRINVRALGYEEVEETFSITDSGSVEVFLDKIYPMEVGIKLDGKDYVKDTIINFISEENSKTILYPQQKVVELSEGEYEIQVYIYKDSSLKLSSSVQEQCVEVPKTGIGGLFGLTEQKCFDVEIPEQMVSTALAAGGKQNYYVSTNQLMRNKNLDISVSSLPTPDSLEQLQDNYALFETKDLGVTFR